MKLKLNKKHNVKKFWYTLFAEHLPLPLPLSSAIDFRPLRPFGCSLVCHHKQSSGPNV